MTEKDFLRHLESVQDRLYRMAIAYFGSETIGKDVLDETVFRALKGHRKLRNDSLFEAWITRILLNECHREWNYQKKKLSLEEILPEQADCADAFDILPMHLAVRSLPVELKEVVLCRFFEDKTIRECAEILGIPEGTVSTRQRKALQLLRQDLEEVEK